MDAMELRADVLPTGPDQHLAVEVDNRDAHADEFREILH